MKLLLTCPCLEGYWVHFDVSGSWPIFWKNQNLTVTTIKHCLGHNRRWLHNYVSFVFKALPSNFHLFLPGVSDLQIFEVVKTFLMAREWFLWERWNCTSYLSQASDVSRNSKFCRRFDQNFPLHPTHWNMGLVGWKIDLEFSKSFWVGILGFGGYSNEAR